MDELTLLRNTRSDTEAPREALNRGRAALLERAAGTTRASRPHRRARRFAIGGLSTVGAAAVVTTLVLTDLVGLGGWRGGADAAAAAALEQAGAAAITSVDPVIEEGQYLRVNTRAVHMASGQSGDEVASFQFLVEETLYRPADPADDWVWDRGAQSVYATFGAASEALAAADVPRADERLRAAAGTFYGGDEGAGFDDLDALPRDPYRLLNHIYRVTLGTGPSPDTEVLVFIADRLRIGTVPADLRAAMYQAAAMVPGVTFVDDQATLDGRTGVAIGRVEDAWGTRVEIIIDPATGEFIGEREVSVRDSDEYGTRLPAGTVRSWTAVTTTVVDAAPAGGIRHDRSNPEPDGTTGGK